MAGGRSAGAGRPSTAKPNRAVFGHLELAEQDRPLALDLPPCRRRDHIADELIDESDAHPDRQRRGRDCTSDDSSDGLQRQVMQRFRRVPPPMGDPPAPTATAEEIAASEARLGFALPPAVRDLYALANGGAGFLGLVNGVIDDLEANAVDLYESFMEPDNDPDAPVPWEWRAGALPILYWGCNTYSCIDCTDDAAPMIGRDGFLWVPDGRPLVQRLGDWANNRLEQPEAPR